MKTLPIKVFTVQGKLYRGHLIGQGMDLYCYNADLFEECEGYWEIELTEQGFAITNCVK
jgi:hypothetical protein